MLPTLAALVMGMGFFAATASAAEVLPTIPLGHFIQISHESDGSSATMCIMQNTASNGSFNCAGGGATWNGSLVGVTNQFGAVVGHRIRITRPNGSATLTYEGAVKQHSGGSQWSWMAGSYTKIQWTWRYTRGRWIRVLVQTGPLPFTGDIGFIDG